MDNSSQTVRTRAFHISYALIRLSRSTPGTFSSYFESYAIDILDRVVSRDFLGSRQVLESIDYILKLAVEGDKVSQNNFELISREVESLNLEISELENAAMLPNIDLSGIFATKTAVSEHFNDAASKSDFAPASESEVPTYGVSSSNQNSKLYGEDVLIKEPSYVDTTQGVKEDLVREPERATWEMRQSAILDRIRQRGYCRLRDIEEAFTDTSERTLRYDLQHLIEKGLVERIGSGGPASFYRVKRSSGEANEIREV